MPEPFDPRPVLQEKRDQLAALPPFPWDKVEAWIAGVRPLIRGYFSAYQEDFNLYAATPEWDQNGVAAVWRDRVVNRLENFEHLAAEAWHNNTETATRAKTALINLLDGILKLPSPQASPITVHLTELIDRLESTPAHPWSGVSAWASGARPFFKSKLPTFLADFEEHVKHPPRAYNPPEADPVSPYPVDPARRLEQFERADYADARENEANAHVAFKALRLFIRGVRDTLLLPPDERQAGTASGDIYNVQGNVNQVTTTIERSNVGAAAIGTGVRATGRIDDRTKPQGDQ